LWLLSAVLLGLWWIRRRQVAATASLTPNANNNSEDRRDREQAANGGHAEALTQLANQATAPAPDWAKL
jgi:hypothetical protein